MVKENRYLKFPFESTIEYVEGKRELTQEEKTSLNEYFNLPHVVASIRALEREDLDAAQKTEILDSVMGFVTNLALTTHLYLVLLEQTEEINDIWIPIDKEDV